MFADILERCRDLFSTDRRDLEYLFRRTTHADELTYVSDREMFANLARGDLTLAALQKSLRKQDEEATAAQFLKYLRQRVLPKFPFRASEREDVAALLVEDREAAQTTVQWAEQICGRTFFSLYRGTFHMGSYLDWYSDLAGKSWFFEHVRGMREKIHQERLHETLKMGPLRGTWDLNALHHLVELGKAWWITNDERFAQQYAIQALDWVEKNPPNMGVNWMDELSVARRVVAWIFAFQLFLTSPQVSADLATRAVKTALMHGAYLADYLRHSRDETRPGYRLAAAASLHLVASAYPEFRSCQRWREIAEALLPAALEEEFGDNGAHRSGSLDMHRLCCEFALLPFIMAEPNGEGVDHETTRRTLQAFQFLVQIQEPDGTAQPIGAIWPERALPFAAAFQSDVPGLLGLAAVLLHREDLRRAARPSWMIVWLSGLGGVNRYQQMGKMAPEADKVRSYEQAALVVLREGWLDKDFWASVRVVPAEAQEVGGRVHDDVMHVSVCAGKSRIFTDTGSLVAEDARSRYFDSPLAHNVVVIRDADPVAIKDGGGQPGGITMLDDNRIWVRAGRRAWRREQREWWHRRDILFDPQRQSFAICDAIDGDGAIDVEVSFQSPLDVEIVQRGDLGCIFWKRTGLFRLHPFFPDTFRGFVEKGTDRGLPAVMSRDGITLEPLQRIRYTARLHTPGWMIFWMTWDNSSNTPSMEEVKSMFSQLGARPAPPSKAAGTGGADAGRYSPTTEALRVSVDVTWLPRDRRGMGRFVLQILQRLLLRDDVWLILCSREKADRAALQLLLGERDRWEFASWTQWTRRDRGEVSWFPWNRIDVLPETPRVVTIHDTAAFDWPKRGLTAFLDNRRAQGQLREAVRRAQRVMTVSRFSAACLQQHLGVTEADVVIEGESLARYAETVWANPRPRPYVLYVGAEDARKNLDGLLAAWAQLHDPQRELVVAGCAGAPREGVHFSGDTDDVALAGLYRWCDLFVMPSFYEGFGLPLLEAMACGAPVAAARAAALPEVGGDVPAWFDPHDVGDIARVLQEVLEDEPRRERMRAAGLERVREFTWERAADQVLACLRRCVS